MRGWLTPILALLAASWLALPAQHGARAAQGEGGGSRGEIPVAAVTIYPGEVITPAMVRMRKVPRRYFALGGFLRERGQIVGKMARRTLVRGRPFAPNALQEPYAVRAGKAVRVIVRSGGLFISALGTALDSAVAGEVVAVRNVDTGRTVYGVARKGGIVIVDVK